MQPIIEKKVLPSGKKTEKFAGKSSSLNTKCKIMAGNLSTEQLEMIAERFRLLSEPMRLRILACLKEGERSVNELVEATGGGQANISRHLNAMRQGGVLSRRKEGTRVFYRIADSTVFELCTVVCREEKELSEIGEVFSRLS